MEIDKPETHYRWCLGQCPGYVPNWGFEILEHIALIVYVLKFHNFDPTLCHAIYIGKHMRMSVEWKKQLVQKYNKIFDTQCVWIDNSY